MRIYKLKKLKRIHGIHFIPDGTRLLAVGGDEVRMVDALVGLDLTTGENYYRIDQYAHSYAIDPGATRLVLCGADEWTGIAPIQWFALTGGDGGWHSFPAVGRHAVAGVAFDPTGTRLAISIWRNAPRRRGVRDSGTQHELVIAQFEPRTELARIPTTDSGMVISFNADGTRVGVTGGIDNDTGAEVYDIATGKRLLRFEPSGTVTRCVQFLPDNRVVVANGRNVYVLPEDKPESQFTFSGYPKQVNALAVTPDGHRILTASHDGTIRVWNVDTGEAGPSFDWKIGAVTAVAFAPDGLTCAAAGIQGRVCVWDVDG